MGGAPKLSDADPSHDEGLLMQRQSEIAQQRSFVDKQWNIAQPDPMAKAVLA